MVMTVGADCKEIKIHLGWNKGKLVFGREQVTYLKVNFRLGPGWVKF
jgi:hypothetical protein